MVRSSKFLTLLLTTIAGIEVLSSAVKPASVSAQTAAAGDPPPICRGSLPTGQVKCNYQGSRAGANYIGSFVNGRPEGKGVYVYGNGDRYEGQFRNGLPNGQGVFIFKNDARVVGVFKDGNISQGTVIFPDGNRYVGQFEIVELGSGSRSSQPSGDGEFIYTNGDRFKGSFFAGGPLGSGVFTRSNGARCQGQFFNQALDGRGNCTFPNGFRYEGEFRGGVPHGQGVIIDTSGKRFPGTFRDGKRVNS
ncbi:MAG: MORN motif-containing protein [Oscillatoriales cyanobacterium SM2_3_0]|nr:MORN motif-containing protein [Oscillatoriales cyanobacterium SM2_3_0]